MGIFFQKKLWVTMALLLLQCDSCSHGPCREHATVPCRDRQCNSILGRSWVCPLFGQHVITGKMYIIMHQPNFQVSFSTGCVCSSQQPPCKLTYPTTRLKMRSVHFLREFHHCRNFLSTSRSQFLSHEHPQWLSGLDSKLEGFHAVGYI